MRIAVGSDHAGFVLKEELRIDLEKWGHEVIDAGCHSGETCDYPDFGHSVAGMVQAGEVERGIIICGTGLGISMAANRHPGIRAALCHNCDSAYFSRAHNDANIIVFGAKYTRFVDARAMLKIFLGTHFSDESRHIQRIKKIDESSPAADERS
jgi:ribose 5-phosphate isomerase B